MTTLNSSSLISRSYWCIRGAPQKIKLFFGGETFPNMVGWGGWFPNRHKTPKNYPENRLFWPEYHLSFSQISQKPWGGWVGKQIWERSPKKTRLFFLTPSLIKIQFIQNTCSQQKWRWNSEHALSRIPLCSLTDDWASFVSPDEQLYLRSTPTDQWTCCHL